MEKFSDNGGRCKSKDGEFICKCKKRFNEKTCEVEGNQHSLKIILKSENFCKCMHYVKLLIFTFGKLIF